mgnify:CR=1 FL=1
MKIKANLVKATLLIQNIRAARAVKSHQNDDNKQIAEKCRENEVKTRNDFLGGKSPLSGEKSTRFEKGGKHWCCLNSQLM